MDSTLLSTALHLALVGSAAVVGMMFALWLLHLGLNNASVVDPGWAFGLALLGSIYAALGPGLALRRALVAGMALFWGVRLGLHLVRRIWGEPEEGRYQQLRRQWRSNVALKFLAFFQGQALLDIILSLPFLIACLNPAPELSWLEYAGVALWAVAVLGEAVADAQLDAFKKNPANRGKVCQAGLWNYSRHPNYFFEWLIWVAWATFALASPYGWAGLLCPLLMFYFLFKLTGIPATEAQSLRSRGDAYREYQRTTSAFVPWFKPPV